MSIYDFDAQMFLESTKALSLAETGALMRIVVASLRVPMPVRRDRLPLLVRMSPDDWRAVEPALEPWLLRDHSGALLGVTPARAFMHPRKAPGVAPAGDVGAC